MKGYAQSSCVVVACLITSLCHGADEAPGPLKVFVLAGQSNMVGKRARVEQLPKHLREAQKEAFFFDGQEWISLEPGKTAPVGFGPEISFANRMTQELKEPVGIIKHSQGGTNLAVQWAPNKGTQTLNKGKHLYAQLLRKVEAAKKARDIEIIGFVWIQGAADSRNQKWAEAYRDNMETFISSVRNDYGSPKMAFVAQRLRAVPSKRLPYMEIVRKANMECEAERYRWINTDDIERGSDNAHFTTAGLVELGHRAAEAMVDLLKSDRE